MSEALQTPDKDNASPFPDGNWARVGVAAGMLAVLVTTLLVMGRHPVCPCGKVRFWQTGLDLRENSQQFADWYSLLHVVFGMALYAFVRFLRPPWSLGGVLLAVLFGHSIWEIAENSPPIIAVFAGATNAPHYAGDSILNSLGDTVFALGGATATAFLPLAAVAVIVALVEVVVTLRVGDGFIVGTLRIFGVDL